MNAKIRNANYKLDRAETYLYLGYSETEFAVPENVVKQWKEYRDDCENDCLEEYAKASIQEILRDFIIYVFAAK